MAGREVREYTNLTDPKDKKLGKGKDKIDDEDVTFQRMVAKMQEVAGERGGYLHGRGALDSDDLLYLKEQMEAEEDAERLLRRTEKRAFAAFKRAASLADSSPASVPLPLRVEPKPKSGIRQQDLLKKVVEIKPKRPRSEGNKPMQAPSDASITNRQHDRDNLKDNKQCLSGQKVEERSLSGLKKVEEHPVSELHESETKPKVDNSAGGLLGLAYASSDDDE
ncbi:uncharacterized protein [Medicago truncatula]|uniref:Uncharacterized protein n=3 Tax=Medicago truncatula TaxID=3880 RepID=G7KPP1_MEDTR|nr:uncharacterized protein LOC11420172 isoform X1 [Medicago truncatula]AES76008.2 hypothetical protein MTR_6g068990 [Medicago truncatula]